MKKLTLHIVSFMIIAAAYESKGQNEQFSQYYNSSLFLNPTFAGTPPDIQVGLSHKRQLQASGISNELSQFSLLYPIVSKGFNARQFGGVGVTALNHKVGEGYSHNGMMLSAAYNVRLGAFSPDYFIFGLQGGFFNRSIDYSSRQWGSQYTPYLPSGFDPNAMDPGSQFNEFVRYPVFNVGLTYAYNPGRDFRLYKYTAFSGFSFKHLNRPNTSFMPGGEDDREEILLIYHGGFEFKLNQRLQWSPNGLFLYNMAGVSQFNVGNNVSYSFTDNRSFSANNIYLTLGVWYRLRDSFIFTTGFQNKNLQVGFSYDLNKGYIFTQPNEAGVASFEISLIYTAGKDKNAGRSSNPLF